MIRSGEAPAVGWLRNMLHSGFRTLHRSVIRRQIGFAARISGTFVKLDEITDGLENTIILIETLTGSQFWTEPKDLEYSSLTASGIRSHHPAGTNACFADDAVYFMSSEISPEELRALLTISGGESITRQSLIERGILRDE